MGGRIGDGDHAASQPAPGQFGAGGTGGVGGVDEGVEALGAHPHAMQDTVRLAHARSDGIAVPGLEVEWDDSVIEDTQAARTQMKDDIARGLCPRWRYLARFYGMTEEEARAFTGEAEGTPSAYAEDAAAGLA